MGIVERLEIKSIKGKKYFYYSKWGRVNGKCRRLWQRYLGTTEAVIKKLTETDPEHRKALYAEVFQFGAPVALWQESLKARVIEIVDRNCKKRDQGLSVGNYVAIAAINRAFEAVSKLGIWEWFSQTSLVRLFPGMTEDDLSSQQFWNNMDKISPENCQAIWKELITGVIRSEEIDLSSVSYDGTNYYTFIDTFNARCSIAKRGKNKQGRANLRQLNYSLFCTADGHIPLLYEVYEGNRNDFTHFPISLKNFQDFFEGIPNSKCLKEQTTIIFDKGNCSEDNFEKIDDSEFYYVTSAKLDEHKELTTISNQDKRFILCSEDLDRTKAFRVKKMIHGKERIVVVSYNDNLFECQWQTLQVDLDKAVTRLSELRQKLEDRENGLVKKGRAATQVSVKTQCKEILSREYMKDIIVHSITVGSSGLPQLHFTIDQEKMKGIADTYLGKNIIITNREKWTDNGIIRGYRSQYMIEEVFKESKDRKFGTWWPQFHWTDTKIYVHALYCTIALLIRALMKRRVEKAGVKISMKRLLTELGGIREVVNVYQGNVKHKKHTETVLSKLSETQETLATILGLSLQENLSS